MIINNFYRIYLTFILINFTICSEITEHFLGANFDMNNKSATFIDKIKCISNSQYQFKLSSKLSVNSVEINGEKKDFTKVQISESQNLYEIKKKFWEPKNVIMTIVYESNSSSFFDKIIQKKIFQLDSEDMYYPTGSESSTKIEFHLKVSKNWVVLSNKEYTLLNSEKNTYKITSKNHDKSIDIFLLKGFQKTPQIDGIEFNLYSYDSNRILKEKYINAFIENKIKMESILGPFPHNKLNLVLSDQVYSSKSLVFANPKSNKNINDIIKKVIFDQYFKYNLIFKDSNNLQWINSIEAYILDYLPLYEKNILSAKLYRKEILNSISLSILPSQLKKYSKNQYEQYHLSTNLFLLFTLEDHIGINNLLKKIRQFTDLNYSVPVNDLNFFQFLFPNDKFDLEFYLSERFQSKIDYPFFEIIESNNNLSIVQPEKVLPLIVPLKYYYKNGVTMDSLLYTKSFKTLISNKDEQKISKIEIDPKYNCLRKFHSTEIESKIRYLFDYDEINVFIPDDIENKNLIKQLLISTFDSTKLNFINSNKAYSDKPSLFIGYLPTDYKFLSTESDLIVNGRKFYLKNHCLAYSYNNKKNNINLIIYSKSHDQIIPVIKKLLFFKNYSYFVLRNGNNADKGLHKTHSKQLTWNQNSQ